MDGSDEAPSANPPVPAPDPPRPRHSRVARLVPRLFIPGVRQGAVGMGSGRANQGAVGQPAGHATQGTVEQVVDHANEADAEQAREDEDASTLTMRGPPKKWAKSTHSSIVALEDDAPAASMSFPSRSRSGSNQPEALSIEYPSHMEQSLKAKVYKDGKTDYLSDAEEEDDEVEILEEAPTIFQTRPKKRAKKLKERLDVRFLRRSRRLASKTNGFKDAESGMKNNRSAEQKAPEEDEVVADEDVAEPTPLAIILGPSNTGAGAHLSKEILEGIANGSIKIHQ